MSIKSQVNSAFKRTGCRIFEKKGNCTLVYVTVKRHNWERFTYLAFEVKKSVTSIHNIVMKKRLNNVSALKSVLLKKCLT